MPNYSNELSRIESLISQSFYPSSVLKSFRVLELGLKDLYKNLKEHLEATGRTVEWEQMQVRFKNDRGEEFNFSRAGFGGMILFARYTRFWDFIREMSDSNLRFIRMVNWGHIRVMRNNVNHEHSDISRVDALEILFWTKIFVYETGLVTSRRSLVPEVLDTECNSCNYSIAAGWNYCPHCGDPTKSNCPSCNRVVNNRNKVCPHCDGIIVGITEGVETISKYKSYAEAIWADWIVTPMEREWLKQKRLELGLTLIEAEEIEKSVIPSNYFIFSEIIEATQVDGKIDRFEKEYLLQKAEQLGIPLEVANNLINSSSSIKLQKSAVKKLMAMF